MEPGPCHTDLSVENKVGGARDGCKKMIQRLDEEKWPPGKQCIERMEVMQARLTMLELNQ